MNDKAWKDESRGRLHIGSFRSEVGGPERVWISAENGLYVDDLPTLDAIIAHLTGLRRVFLPIDDNDLRAWLLCYLGEMQPRSTLKIMRDAVSAYLPYERLKVMILELGDSRRGNDAELILGRDDRTEAMMSEEERALMPKDEFGRYYATAQRRGK